MEFMVKCCECNRVRMGERWLPELEAVRERTVFSHSYCPECLCKIMAQLEAWSPSSVLEEAPVGAELNPVAGG